MATTARPGTPAASVEESTPYGPCGVHVDDDVLVVADTGNHRVMRWRRR